MSGAGGSPPNKPGPPPQFMLPEDVVPTEPEPEPAPAPVEAAPLPEEPLLPATYDENDLRAAVGASSRPTLIRARTEPVARSTDDDDDDAVARRGGEPGGRKLMVIGAATLVVGIGIATIVLLGRTNSARRVLSCEARQIVAERGRTFPPWGEKRIEGDEWNPIPIPADFVCVDAEYETTAELGDSFRGKLLERADAMLVAGESANSALAADGRGKIDDAAALLEQALLLARLDSDAHDKARTEIKRRLGDVGYWRATAKLKEASTALADAAKQFDAASLQEPRYVKDAAAWAALARRLGSALTAGPTGELGPAGPIADSTPLLDRPSAPPGTALPIEAPAAGSAGSSAPPPPPAPPDAGVPSGGVLF